MMSLSLVERLGGAAGVGAVLAVSAALWSAPAMANTYTVPDFALNGLTLVGSSSGSSDLTQSADTTHGHNYTASFGDSSNAGAFVNVGYSGIDVAHADGDALQLYIYNANANSWTYQLFTGNGDSSPIASAVTIGSTVILSAILGGTADVTSFFIQITPVVALGEDNQAQFAVSTVPLPGALVLLGSGLAGLGLLGRRKGKKVDQSTAVAA